MKGLRKFPLLVTLCAGLVTLSLSSATAHAAIGAPQNLRASDTPGGVALNWEGPADTPGIIGYEVRRRLLGEKGFSVLAETAQTTHLDTTVEAGKTYAYRVRAKTHDGTGPSSPSVTQLVAYPAASEENESNLRTQIAELQNQVAALQALVDTHQSSLLAQIAANSAVIAVNSNDLTANSAEIAALKTTDAGINADIAQNKTDISANSDILEELPELPQCIQTVAGAGQIADVVFRGCNVHVQNGEGNTDSTNSLGNLFIGYNEIPQTSYTRGLESFNFEAVDEDDRTGSHNLVLGIGHSYTSYGGLVAGLINSVTGTSSSVLGGYGNYADGAYSTVSGGSQNQAQATSSSVNGGNGNTASGKYASVSGGADNTASGSYSSVSGGYNNTASNLGASVSGGRDKTASEQYASEH